MARLKMAARKAMSPSEFVFPERAPGHGSYPIPDRGHAQAALRFAAGTADEGRVRSAVCKKFGMGCNGK